MVGVKVALYRHDPQIAGSICVNSPWRRNLVDWLVKGKQCEQCLPIYLTACNMERQTVEIRLHYYYSRGNIVADSGVSAVIAESQRCDTA